MPVYTELSVSVCWSVCVVSFVLCVVVSELISMFITTSTRSSVNASTTVQLRAGLRGRRTRLLSRSLCTWRGSTSMCIRVCSRVLASVVAITVTVIYSYFCAPYKQTEGVLYTLFFFISVTKSICIIYYSVLTWSYRLKFRANATRHFCFIVLTSNNLIYCYEFGR